MALSDRFGDSGLTGLVVLRFAGSDAEVDTLLVSCRVLGRRVEDALLAFIAARARERGAHRLIGLFLPSGKNDLTRDFYADRGFARDGDGRFVLDLEEGRLAAPSGITVEVATLA